jgi:hypothetical protein
MVSSTRADSSLSNLGSKKARERNSTLAPFLFILFYFNSFAAPRRTRRR